MKKESFSIPLARLGEGTHEYEFHCDRDFFAQLGREGIEESDVLAKVSVTRRGDRYKLRFSVEGTLTIPCHRCLDPLQIPVDAVYDLNVGYGDEYDDSIDGVLTLPETDTTLSVGDIIADTIMLEIPMRAVHDEGQCNPEMESRLN